MQPQCATGLGGNFWKAKWGNALPLAHSLLRTCCLCLNLSSGAAPKCLENPKPTGTSLVNHQVAKRKERGNSTSHLSARWRYLLPNERVKLSNICPHIHTVQQIAQLWAGHSDVLECASTDGALRMPEVLVGKRTLPFWLPFTRRNWKKHWNRTERFICRWDTPEACPVSLGQAHKDQSQRTLLSSYKVQCPLRDQPPLAGDVGPRG